MACGPVRRGRALTSSTRLQSWDSPKGSSRLHVSSGAKYAFASPLDGRRPIIPKDVLYSACSPVKEASPPGRAGRFTGTEYRSVPPREGIQPLGYHHQRQTTRRPGRGGVGFDFLTRSSETVKPSSGRRPRLETGERRYSNYGSTALKLYGFIPRLKSWAFSCTSVIGTESGCELPRPTPSRRRRSVLEVGASRFCVGTCTRRHSGSRLRRRFPRWAGRSDPLLPIRHSVTPPDARVLSSFERRDAPFVITTRLRRFEPRVNTSGTVVSVFLPASTAWGVQMPQTVTEHYAGAVSSSLLAASPLAEEGGVAPSIGGIHPRGQASGHSALSSVDSCFVEFGLVKAVLYGTRHLATAICRERNIIYIPTS